MSRKKKRGRPPGRSKKSAHVSENKTLGQETMHSVWALIFVAVAVVLILAGFGKAGTAGEAVYEALFWVLGWGYVFFPLTCLGIALNFLITTSHARIYATTFWGSLLFLAGALGFIDVTAPTWGGVVGSIAGYPYHWFGPTAWGIITLIAAIIGILVVLDRPLKLARTKDEKEERHAIKKEVEKKESINTIPLPDTQDSSTDSSQEKNEKDLESEEEKTETDGQNMPSKKRRGAITSVRKDENYVYPPKTLLRSSSEKPGAGDLRANANIIKRTLESFGIPVEMGEINIGPKVTRYTLRPAEGVKLSRITSLNSDLALALASHPIRIEAPIPGKPYVGIEVPNHSAAIVRLGSLIAYPEFGSINGLSFPLGRDVTGQPMFASIEKMPHLLIAGATGSGKSITLHALLISLLYKNSPKTLRMLLIDPKRVELSSYNGLPHLIAPVITEGKKSLAVFRWAIAEMERRYDTLLEAGTRDIQSYNKKSGSTMPYIIIVVDEMADLMAAYGRDIENAVVRLAQMARATGIHLVLSTQRPSVEVITGLIKANITSRIALQVASQVDSRTILDTSGAEKLLGGGDFLFVSAQLSKPKRLQGSYVSEEEIKAVTDFIKDNNKDYTTGDEDVDLGESNTADYGGDDIFDSFQKEDLEDDLLPDAIELVRQTQKASASFLQRRLRVGYARAARLLDLMEDRGLVGPSDGAKPREVYVAKDEE